MKPTTTRTTEAVPVPVRLYVDRVRNGFRVTAGYASGSTLPSEEYVFESAESMAKWIKAWEDATQ